MKKRNKEKFAPVANHKVVTRRDFLAQGYVGAVGVVLAPNLLSVAMSSVAQAACPSDVAGALAAKTPVMIFDLAGGANFAGSDVIVGKAGGQMDYLAAGSYQSVGLPPDQHPSLAGMTTTINGRAAGQGLLFHSNSDLLRGMRTGAGTALNNTDGFIFCTASGDDTSNNPHNPAYWLYKAGAKGSLVNVVGNNDSDSGGNAVVPAPSYDPSVRSVQIQRPEQVLGLVQLGAVSNIFASGGSDKVKKILEAAEATSGRKLASFNSMDLSAQIQELVNCGFIDSKALIGKFSPAAIGPAQDAAITAAFPALASNQNQQKTASVAKLVLDGLGGVGTVTLGGYDYHGQGRQTQAQKQIEAGELIGRSIAAAAAKGKDLMVILYSDGGVSSGTTVNNTTEGRGRFNFDSDSGNRSSALIFVHRAGGGLTLRDNNRQIGAYTDQGSVDRLNSQVSDNVVSLSKAFVANYLALHGEEGRLAQVVGTETLSGELNRYVKVTKIR